MLELETELVEEVNFGEMLLALRPFDEVLESLRRTRLEVEAKKRRVVAGLWTLFGLGKALDFADKCGTASHNMQHTCGLPRGHDAGIVDEYGCVRHYCTTCKLPFRIHKSGIIRLR